MSLWWSLALLSAAPAPATIALYPRTAVVFLDTARTLPPEDVRSIQVAGDKALQADTSLELVLPTFVDLETSAYLGCPPLERFGCWSSLSAKAKDPVSYLLVLAAQRSTGGRARLGGLWLDVRRALAVPRSLSGPDRENWIFEQAVVPLPSAESSIDEASLATYFTELFRIRLRDRFERAGVWDPYDTIEIVGASPDYAIALDDERVGTTAESTTTLEGVPRGSHRLEIRRGDHVAFEGAVEAGASVTIEEHLVEQRAATNAAVSYGGFALAAVGVALIVYAAAATPTPAAGACAGPGCPPPSGSGWITSCQLGRYDDACVRDPSGVLVPGVGLSMALGGVGIGIGGLFVEQGADVPWWSIAAGVAIGAITYGASVLLFYPEGVR